MLIPGQVYQHYKTHGQYQILCLALNEADLEPVVVYQSLAEADKIWVRPLVSFTEDVEYEGKTQKRFSLREEPMAVNL